MKKITRQKYIKKKIVIIFYFLFLFYKIQIYFEKQNIVKYQIQISFSSTDLNYNIQHTKYVWKCISNKGIFGPTLPLKQKPYSPSNLNNRLHRSAIYKLSMSNLLLTNPLHLANIKHLFLHSRLVTQMTNFKSCFPLQFSHPSQLIAHYGKISEWLSRDQKKTYRFEWFLSLRQFLLLILNNWLHAKTSRSAFYLGAMTQDYFWCLYSRCNGK